MSKSASRLANADLCVSCVNGDRSFVRDYFLGVLKGYGYSVWFVDKPDSEKDNGLAIVQCKIFLPILSEESAKSEISDNELSLAYVANKSIIPIAREGIRKINPLLNSGVKLMLAKINWTFFTKPEQYADTSSQLLDAIKLELNHRKQLESEENEGTEMTAKQAYGALNNHAPNTERQDIDAEMMDDGVDTCEHIQHSINCDFWERHFSQQNEVSWNTFKAMFLADYSSRITRQLGSGKDVWLTLLIYKDIFELYKVISKQKYADFCGPNAAANPDHFYDRVKGYAVDILAMRNIFNMGSSLRLVAIQNLGSFQTPSVIILLFDLVDHSEDPNVRTLASLALAKAGKKSQPIQNRLIKLLKDEDRLVRESACLSLAHVQCTRAVPNILELWRNDAIKHVREAAELALHRMGGKAAEQAIHITELLSKEMKSLRENRPKAND